MTSLAVTMRRASALVAAIAVVAVGMALPHRTFAAFNDVQLTADTTLQANGVSIIALSGANVASLATDGTTIDIGLESGSTITLRSDDKRALTASPAIATYTCESSSSQIIFSGSSTQTITVSVSAASGCASTSSSSSSSSSSSGGGGGGGGGTPPTPPTGATVSINGGVATTASLTVTLTLGATNATQVLVGNSTAFTDLTSWVPLTATMSWTLPAGAGEKTVYAKFRSSSGAESAVVKDTITVLAGAVAQPTPTPSPVAVVPPVTAPPATAPATQIAPGTLVKEAGKPAVYLVVDGTRRVFRNADIFLAHGYQWSQVQTVANLTGVSAGDPVDYPVVPGMLVKGLSPKVYLIAGGKRRWITNEQVFTGLGYPWSAIRVLFDDTLDRIPEGESISQAQVHVDGTLIKYAGNPKVYVVEGGKKRWIPSEQAFTQHGYRWENIWIIPNTFAYPDGVDVTAPAAGQVLGVAHTLIFTSTLSYGSSGAEVLALQQLLLRHGFFPSDNVPNGRFGPTTVSSVKRFQTAQGISAIGVVGPKTREALNQLAGQQ